MKESKKDSDLAKLRGILRGLIKEISLIDKPKEELLKMLDSLGFGERPWRKGLFSGEENPPPVM